VALANPVEPESVNPHAIEVLEFRKVLEVIAVEAGTNPGRERIMGLQPAAEPNARGDERRLRIAEALGLRLATVDLPITRFESPAELLRLAAPVDSALPAEAFTILQMLITSGRSIETFLNGRNTAGSPALRRLGARFPELKDLQESIGRVFDANGAVRDQASARLAETRHRIGVLDRRIHQQLNSLVSNPGFADVIQENQIVVRNQRYVIPVRREQRGRMPGVVHDQSNTGHTLFMEPTGTIEDGNELAALRLEERDELRRILQGLTKMVRQHATEIDELADDLAEYDVGYAVSRWAVEYDCRYVPFGEDLKLVKGRHPLLLAQFRAAGREADVVPLDLALPPERRALVVSGPNAGGKTVILKTLGLLMLTAQADLPVPCDEGTELRRVAEVFADIGDEQSLATSLSTFSSHLTHLRDILKSPATAAALVLLDELGAGTDPMEGGALACAVLETLADRVALLVATTHLPSIKQFVHTHPRMVNASVLFNTETLRPEYVLQVGRPGASHAMTIARNIGIPPAVLDRAASFMQGDQLKLEVLLSQLDEDQRELHVNLRDLRAARERILREQTELTEELKVLRGERHKRLHEAQREAAAIVADTRREMEHLLRLAREPGKQPESVKELRQRADALAKSLDRDIEETKPKPAAPVPAKELHVGQRVWVEPLREHGEITQLSGDRERVKVSIKGMVFEVHRAELGKPGAAGSPAPEVRSSPAGRPLTSQTVRPELNLIGQRVEPALDKLEKYLDDAALAGLSQVRIIHGFGTGALRQGVHERLRESGVVKSFRLGEPDHDPGGGGVTWVDL
jgi:DNA mismatch repair protein MutS2